MNLLLACLSMAFQDFFGTFLTVAEARGRTWLAGAMDAFGDLAKWMVQIYGAGLVIQHGWTPYSILVIAATTVVSFFGTTYWTKLSRRLPGATPEEVVALQERVEALEAIITQHWPEHTPR